MEKQQMQEVKRPRKMHSIKSRLVIFILLKYLIIIKLSNIKK